MWLAVLTALPTRCSSFQGDFHVLLIAQVANSMLVPERTQADNGCPCCCIHMSLPLPEE